MAQLQGLSYDWAHLFGMPHIGARYTDYDTGDYEMLYGEACVLCGRQGTNVHHVVPRSVRKAFFLGDHMLRSPLMALCGSGTLGCHNGMHGGARYKVRWEWDCEALEDAWWSGRLLERFGPHDDRLFEMGQYVVEDRKMGYDIVLRA